ncbi:MAG: ABC transporter permease, partial [Chloroflexi bacterium]|nr:ABC transporter permease [Chloroflexota bacterium]
MISFVANRLARSFIVIILISIVTFIFMQLAPGGPFSSDPGGRPRAPAVQAKLEARYGLDRPPVEQYLRYMSNLILRFDFGPSMRQKDYSVNQLLFGVDFWSDPLNTPVLISAQLGLMAFALAVGIGIPLGVVSALYYGRG